MVMRDPGGGLRDPLPAGQVYAALEDEVRVAIDGGVVSILACAPGTAGADFYFL